MRGMSGRKRLGASAALQCLLDTVGFSEGVVMQEQIRAIFENGVFRPARCDVTVQRWEKFTGKKAGTQPATPVPTANVDDTVAVALNQTREFQPSAAALGAYPINARTAGPFVPIPNQMRKRRDHTLAPAALVHDAFVKRLGQEKG